MLKIALPNGSLQQKTLELFRKAGINLPALTRQHWVEVGHELVKTIIWMRPQYIPEAIDQGLTDAGITGSDCYEEWWHSSRAGRTGLKQLCQLVYSKKSRQPTRVALVASTGDSEDNPEDGEVVFTEYPFWTPALLPEAAIKPCYYGSLEALVPALYRYGITVVETGDSLRENELRLVKVLALSYPGLFIKPDLGAPARQLATFLAARLVGVEEED